ncbi:Glycoside hydrolase, family 71 [Penicillium italicum]|uniref:Glycoside hydrolase, family 71 n=1 Tax=Penicillium italicum TaxID=40296 RepID=A0A0A2KPL4_PENIT|nr:Glycoside hydrolase, family 71 [Penicillium italicum]
MNWFAWLALMVTFQVIHQANAKAVFAHFMVTNSENYTASDWQSDFKLAQNAHIDAFALNMAWEDKTNDASVAMAFTAAEAEGFRLFFSFDYAGNGPWDQDVVTSMIQKYSSSSSYFQYNGKPFVSTFEGPSNADDWVTIKAKTNCFFVPDWSSVGAKPAVELANGVADGLFSWSAWPWGNQTMDTYTDASYIQYLEGKPYMMAISPWFYTNLPGYNKNWLWNSGSLWHDRWQELYALDPMPEFVEIISWNDYGESHYIGPIRENALAALDIGEAPFDFVTGYPHDAWRDMLPFLIDLYKTGSASMGNGLATFWYTPNPLDYCSVGGTTLNTASQLQIEYNPKDKLEARIWVMSLFSDGNNAVFVNDESVEWDFIPDGSVGAAIRFGSVAAPIGSVEVNLIVHGAVMQSPKTIDITTSCDGGFNNFNAWVGSVGGGSPYGDIYSTSVDIKDQECVQGKGAYDFNALCNFTCSYGYCPISACTCEQMGAARSKPKVTGTTGYPAEGKDANYVGLCSFACNYGYCPSATCDTTEHPIPVPTVSDFLPPACVAGTAAAKCTDSEKEVIEIELQNAVEMAQVSAVNLETGTYLDNSFNGEGDTQFISDTKETFQRISSLLTGNDPNFPVTLACDPRVASTMCKRGYVAFMNNSKQRLTFCAPFFQTPDPDSTTPQVWPAKDVLDDNSTDLRKASRARSAVLVHEATHTKYGMLGKPFTRDIAYIFNSCRKLARSNFNRSCRPQPKQVAEQGALLDPPTIECPVLGPDGMMVEGLCDQELARKNAENYQLLAAGVYFTEKTSRTIPLPVLPASTSATECVVADDYILWDDVNNDIPDVTGQVHFGDSFAAGMGTGNTPKAQKCRVGSNNFGQLLYKSFAGGFDYQNLACSGDTVAGMYNKLHGWQNPTVDSLATMTIGGNDLDFSNIVKHCILRYLNAFIGWNAAWCYHYKSAAKSLMADTGADGLQYKLTSIYLRIIGWAQQNPDFNLYIAGYPRFFNADTTQCNDVSFRYWGWDKTDRSDVWLTNSLRTEMNDLVTSLNTVIEAAVLDANNLVGKNVTHFVDVDPSFEGHRWCEPGVIEPDPSHMSTAFFLSGWPDIEEGATVAAAADDSSDLSVLQASGSLPLPDGNTCNTTLGVDPDPVDVYWCDLASAVVSDPDGDIANQVVLANTALASGDFTAQDVSWFLPTRQIKTFHPRSIGMAFYRDAILAARMQVEYGY